MMNKFLVDLDLKSRDFTFIKQIFCAQNFPYLQLCKTRNTKTQEKRWNRKGKEENFKVDKAALRNVRKYKLKNVVKVQSCYLLLSGLWQRYQSVYLAKCLFLISHQEENLSTLNMQIAFATLKCNPHLCHLEHEHTPLPYNLYSPCDKIW